jgi:hypothetical protein
MESEKLSPRKAQQDAVRQTGALDKVRAVVGTESSDDPASFSVQSILCDSNPLEDHLHIQWINALTAEHIPHVYKFVNGPDLEVIFKQTFVELKRKHNRYSRIKAWEQAENWVTKGIYIRHLVIGFPDFVYVYPNWDQNYKRAGYGIEDYSLKLQWPADKPIIFACCAAPLLSYR